MSMIVQATLIKSSKKLQREAQTTKIYTDPSAISTFLLLPMSLLLMAVQLLFVEEALTTLATLSFENCY